MGITKQVASGNLNLEFTVGEEFGLLNEGTAVQMHVGPPIPSYMVAPLGATTGFPNSIGLVAVPNKEIGGKCVVSTVGRALEQGKLTGGISFLLPGAPVLKTEDGKITFAGYSVGANTLQVLNSPWPGGETITFSVYTITNGVEFNSGGDNNTTAREIARAINLHIPRVMAKVNGPFITISALSVTDGEITVASTADPADLAVNGNIPAGNFTLFRPYGLALNAASLEDDPIDVLVF
nr:hypothetical protein 6 [bacterium]